MYVLFLDDSCGARAPIAEAILRHHAPAHDTAAAGWSPSHVRPEVRTVLSEAGLPTDRLRARGLASVGVEDVDVLVSFVPDEGRVRVPAHARRLSWGLPDPLAAPPAERMEAMRAARDEIERRVLLLAKELG